jgi:hemolysin D
MFRLIPLAVGAWRNDRRTQKPPRLSRADAAFLPAAVEVADTPPPLLVSLLPLLLGLFTAAAIGWAWWGRIDIVSSAEGRIVPTERVKLVQPSDMGVVRRILVREGQAVAAGEPLIELDPTEADAERERTGRQLLIARLQEARLATLLARLADPAVPFAPPPSAALDAMLVETQRRLLETQWAALRQRTAAASGEVAKSEAQREMVAAQLRKQEAILPLIRERAGVRRQLADQQLLARSNWLELQQGLVEVESEIGVLRQSLRHAGAEVQLAAERLAQIRPDQERDWLGEVAAVRREAAALDQDLRKAESRAAGRQLVAPAAGVVQELAVHTVGGVVRQADVLMRIVPEDQALEIEATIRNRDIGFVRAGQDVEIKVETFPYTLYGTVPGRVLDVSADSVSPDARSTGPVYRARIALDRRQIQVAGNQQALLPGMAVTVDVKTGTRSVLDYILTPVVRLHREGLRER